MTDNDTQNQVQFQGERNVLYGRFESSNKTPGVVEMLMRFGIAKTREQATYVLLGLIIACIGGAIVLFSSMGDVNRPLPKGTITNMPNEPPRLLIPQN